ncbi:PBSX family phage terminase large subunit [Tessaracoccus sp.]
MFQGLAERQLQSIRDAKGRVNIWEGAIRSGKTIGSIISWLLFIALVHDRPGELVMIGRTRNSVWSNVLGPMMEGALFGVISDQVVGNYGSPFVYILGRRVHVMGAHDAKAEKVLRGMTVLGCYVDEVTTIPKDFFTQLLGRMSPPGARMFGTTNPDGPKHWLKKDYLDRVGKGLDNWRTFHFNLTDNPSLSEDYKSSIMAEYTGLWYKRFIQGLWVQAEGAIFDSWDELEHVVTPDMIPAMDAVMALGVDYGTTNATSGMLLGMAQEKLWLLDEWAPKAEAGHSLTDAEQSASLRKWLPARRPGSGPDYAPGADWRTPSWVYVDPAAASFRLQLYSDGMGNVAPAWNDVLPGIRLMSSLMATKRLKVSTACRNFLEEVPGYAWDPKATEEGEDAPIKANDHFLDGARYAIMSTTPMWRHQIPIYEGTP